MDWNKTRETFRTLFADQGTAEMINIQVPVAEMDWDYTVTLENDDSLQIVIKGDCQLFNWLQRRPQRGLPARSSSDSPHFS